MDDDAFDDLALRRLSVPATAPGHMSRRRFLQLTGGGVGLAAAAGAGGSLFDSLRAFAAPAIGPTDGVLVLVMLDGGNDALNMVVPTGSAKYYDLRPRIAIPAAQALPIATGPGFTRGGPGSSRWSTRGRSRSCPASATGPPT
jgi:uncharacterized protein (DUF1501 family)